MSEAQAIETSNEEIEIEPIEVIEKAEVEEVEIVVEGEEEPTSVPLHQMKKRLGRASRKIASANAEKDESTRRAEMLEEENKLLRLQAQQGKTSAKRPDEGDFGSNQEYLTALDEYDDQKFETIATKKASEQFAAIHAQATQSQRDEALSQQIDKHYERSAALKVPDYDEAEGKAVDALGDEVAKQIVANTDDSHLLMYHLGKNPAKAQQLKALIESNPMKGVMEIGRLAGTLKAKPKGKIAPDPETNVQGGAASRKKRGAPGAKFI